MGTSNNSQQQWETINFTKKKKKKWECNSTHLSNQWVKGEIRKEIGQYLGANENEMSTYQNLHIMKFITVSAYIKRKISNKQSNVIPQRIREQIELKIRK